MPNQRFFLNDNFRLFPGKLKIKQKWQCSQYIDLTVTFAARLSDICSIVQTFLLSNCDSETTDFYLVENFFSNLAKYILKQLKRGLGLETILLTI